MEVQPPVLVTDEIRRLLGELRDVQGTPIITRTTKVHSFRDIDQVINDVQVFRDQDPQIILTIKRLRNSALPLYRLPPELWEGIISPFLATLKESEYVDYFALLRTLRLVSTRWSDVIGGTPKFWAKISNKLTPHEIAMALERSSNGPLKIKCEEGGESRIGTYYAQIRGHANRWMALSIYSNNRSIVREFLQTPTPNLASFELTASRSYSLDVPSDDDESFVPFGGTRPPLRDVHIYGWSTMKWDATPLLFSGLRSLILSNIFQDWPRSWALIHILSSSPQLEALGITSIHVALPTINELVEAGPIVLPRLRTLTLRYVDVAIERLLTIVTFPYDARVSLARVLYDGDEEEFVEVVGAWIAKASTNARWDACPKVVEMVTRPPVHDFEVKVDWGEKQLELELTDYVSGRFIRSATLAVMMRLNEGLRRATERAVIDVQGELECLVVLDEAFPCITHLTLKGAGSHDVLELLAAPTSTGKWLLNGLQELTIENSTPLGATAIEYLRLIVEERRAAATSSSVVYSDVELVIQGMRGYTEILDHCEVIKD